MNNNFIIDDNELSLAKSIVELASDDKIIKANLSSTVIDKLIKQLKIMTPVYIVDKETNVEISVALISAQSKVLEKMYQYDNKIKIPKFIYDRLLFRNLKATGKCVFDMMIHGDQYNLNMEKNIDWSSLTFNDLFYYIEYYECLHIEKSNFDSVRLLVTIFIIDQIRRDDLDIEECGCNSCSNLECNSGCAACSYIHQRGCTFQLSFDKCKKTCENYSKFYRIPKMISIVIDKLGYLQINKILIKNRYSRNKMNIVTLYHFRTDMIVFPGDQHKYMVTD